jgi:hypothetical protein
MTAVIQARRAPNADLRTAMSLIARDEARHARLAWEVDAWVRTKLTRADIRRVDDARRAEGAKLERQVVRASVSPLLSRELGLPTAAQLRCLVSDARRALWLT